MYERATTFVAAIAAQAAQVAVLGFGGRAGRAAPGSRMPGGIVWSISASSDGTPMAREHRRRVRPRSGPMWR